MPPSVLLVVAAASDSEQRQLGANAPINLEAVMRQPLVLLFAVLLCRCAMMTGSPVADVLTPRELNTHPEQYDGRDVIVRGFVILGTNGRSLYQSKERFEEFGRAFYAQTPGFNPAEYDADCVTLLNARVLEENSSVFNGRTVTMRGRFVRDYLTGDMLDLQACGTTALALDERDTRRLLQVLQHAH